MTIQQTGRTNGTYHGPTMVRERKRRTHWLIAISAVLVVFAVVNVMLINADMSRLERAGPERLALAGDGLQRFVPSILSNLQRAQQPANAVNAVLADDPRHSPAYVEDKRALERWMAVTGLCLAALFIALEGTIPLSTV